MSNYLTTTIIAEAGVNHNGSLVRALELVDRAAAAGADIVKFQTFRADALASANARKADYQQRAGDADENQLEMLRRLELSPEDHRRIMKRCAERGIRFLSSPFDSGSLHFLIDELGLGEIKLGSGELTNGPMLLEVGRQDVKVLLSTGMATLGEVEEALGVLAFAMASGSQTPSRANFARALAEPSAWMRLRDRVTLLHCTTEYPAPDAETNLRAMDTMAQAFGLPVGYSDHTEGLAIGLAAVARGARVLEKHFTLSRELPGPDHAASLEPDELAEFVRQTRRIEVALGSGVKQPGARELANRQIARKSVVATRALPARHRLAASDMAIKRPATGASPMCYWDLLGTRLDRDVVDDEPL